MACKINNVVIVVIQVLFESYHAVLHDIREL